MSRRPTGSLEIGRRIREARTALKMSQAELAEKANLSSAQISHVETVVLMSKVGVEYV